MPAVRRTFIFSDKLRERDKVWTCHMILDYPQQQSIAFYHDVIWVRTFFGDVPNVVGGQDTCMVLWWRRWWGVYWLPGTEVRPRPVSPVLDRRSGRVLSCEESGDSPRETDRPPVLSSPAPSQGVSSPLNSGLTVTTQPPSSSPLAARKLLRPEALIWSGGKVLRGWADTSLEMATTKRKCQDCRPEEEEEEEGVREKRRRVEWRDVTIYNFKRRQGFVCVPSQVRLIYSRD